MTPTISIMTQKFNKFNEMFFEGHLIKPTLKVSRTKTAVGQCVTYYQRDFLGRTISKKYKISMSQMFEFTEQDIDEVLLHEMVHLYISQNDIKDNASHGKEFWSVANRIMDECNRRYVITKTRNQSVNNSANFSVTAIAYPSADNRIFVFVSAKNRIKYFVNYINYLGKPNIVFDTTDIFFFKDFPLCRRTMRGRYIEPAQLRKLCPKFKAFKC